VSFDWSLAERPKRHRGAYKPELADVPFELSRSKIETYVKCKQCFYLEKIWGVKPPSIPGFNLNSNTDTLLKRDFNQYRGREAHPIMASAGLQHLVPFEHEDLEKWENALQFGATPNHFNTLHKESNIIFGGGLDDVWVELVRPMQIFGRDDTPQGTGKLHIVDYKSTAQLTGNPKPLDESFLAPPEGSNSPDYKASYRRQMDMYQWVMRRKGFEVSDIGYFVYVDGQHVGIDGMIDKDDPATAWMKFNTAVIPYKGDDSWVEGTLKEIRSDLDRAEDIKHNPDERNKPHAGGCELARYLYEAIKATDWKESGSKTYWDIKNQNTSGNTT